MRAWGKRDGSGNRIDIHAKSFKKGLGTSIERRSALWSGISLHTKIRPSKHFSSSQ